MKKMNITLLGVGGQGIGLLSETLLRAFDHAGLSVKGVDTHGLAQRGGSVVSHLRIGFPNGNPLVEEGKADLLMALERTEALRGMEIWLRDGGKCFYYDANWQSLPVRLGKSPEITEEDLQREAQKRKIALTRIYHHDLPDPRMQNMVLLGRAVREGALGKLEKKHVKRALEDLLGGALLNQNIALLDP